MSLWDIVEEVRVQYEQAGYAKLRRTHVVLDPKIDTWMRGGRTVGQCSGDGLKIWFSPRVEMFDSDRQRALAAHEFGHAVQGLYGMQADEDDYDGVEREADRIAERVMRQPLYYAPIEGRLIQTFNALGGTRPRPAGLR